MLNPRGGIEADFTVTRLGADRFRIITGTAFGEHDRAWIRLHAPEDGSVILEDVTSAYACLGLWGPQARAILQPLTRTDISNRAFPYLTAQAIIVGDVPALAARVTYVGELGWELYAPMEYGQKLWDTLWEAGARAGLAAGGYRAIESLRLEKGYRYWSGEIGPDHTPYEAGLGFAVKLDKGDFIGRAALLRQKAEGLRRRLGCLVLADPTAIALGNEPIRQAGQVVGWVATGGYGYSVRQSLAYAYLPVDLAGLGNTFDVELFGERVPATVVPEPVWDPRGERLRA
jgi:4-methylaminobutanoate oxidase (formaldehyde-forming)